MRSVTPSRLVTNTFQKSQGSKEPRADGWVRTSMILFTRLEAI